MFPEGHDSSQEGAALPQVGTGQVRRGTFLSPREMDDLAAFLFSTSHSLVLNARYLEPDWFAEVFGRLVRRRSFGSRTLVLRAPSWTDHGHLHHVLRERNLGVAAIVPPSWTLIGAAAPKVVDIAVPHLAAYRTSWARRASLQRCMQELGDGGATQALGYLTRHGVLHQARGQVRLARSVVQHRHWADAWLG